VKRPLAQQIALGTRSPRLHTVIAQFAIENEPSFEEIVSGRQESAAKSVRSATPEELRKLLDEIFSADPSHPWHKSFRQFLEDHKDENAHRGETSDGYSFVF
jgi:hypothetical protein